MMNRIGREIPILLISAIIALLFFGNNSCKKIKNPNAGKGIKDTLSYDYLTTRIFVQFVDAATDQNITTYDGDHLSVEIIGKSKNAVVDILGIQKDRYYPQNGFISFGIVPEYAPSLASPTNFTIKTKIYNHISALKEVTITDEGDYYVKIPIINLDNPPEGVLIKRMNNVGNLYAGVLYEDVIIESENSEAQVKIPGGTKLKGADSTVLAGKLNLTLIYHSLNSDKAMATIPGGIVSSILKNNNISGALFFPTGVVDLIITDSDYKQAQFIEDRMLEVTMTVPNGTYNPDTYSNYKSGDNIEVFTYLQDTGLWNYDKSVTIEPGLNGLKAVLVTSGLYSYNFSNKVSVSCNQGATFKLTGGCQDCNSIVIDGVIRKDADDSFITNLSLAATQNEIIHIPYRTGDVKVYIDWNESAECSNCTVDPVYGHLPIDNMCTQPQTNLPLIDNGSVTTSINAYFTGQCASDTNYLILPSFGIWVRNSNSQCWQWNSMKLGLAEICNLAYGETYIVGTYYNNIWQEWEMKIENDSDKYFTLIFSNKVCNDVFGIL